MYSFIKKINLYEYINKYWYFYNYQILPDFLNVTNTSYKACIETGNYMQASAAESKKSFII